MSHNQLVVVLPLKFLVWERKIGKVPATLRICDVKLSYLKEIKPSPSQVLIHKHIKFLPFYCTASDQSHVFPIPLCAAFWFPCVAFLLSIHPPAGGTCGREFRPGKGSLRTSTGIMTHPSQGTQLMCASREPPAAPFSSSGAHLGKVI